MRVKPWVRNLIWFGIPIATVVAAVAAFWSTEPSPLTDMQPVSEVGPTASAVNAASNAAPNSQRPSAIDPATYVDVSHSEAAPTAHTACSPPECAPGADNVAAGAQAPSLQTAPVGAGGPPDYVKKIMRDAKSRELRSNAQMISMAKRTARDDRACAKGDKKACGRLHTNGKDRRAELAHIKTKLAKACDEEEVNACVHLGDVEGLGTTTASSNQWYDRARELVRSLRGRCAEGKEKIVARCGKADKLEAAIEKRRTKGATTSH